MGVIGSYARPAAPTFAATGVTDANGNVTFNFPAGRFSAAPVVALALQAAAANDLYEWRITAISATALTIKVTRAAVVTVVAVSVLGAPANAAGVTVHMQAQAAG